MDIVTSSRFLGDTSTPLVGSHLLASTIYLDEFGQTFWPAVTAIERTVSHLTTSMADSGYSIHDQLE